MHGEKKIKGSTVRLEKYDITDYETQAFVYYAQHDLKLGAGFGNAIATRGGLSVQKELEGLGPLETTQAVVTAAGKMKADFIVHAVGPRFQEEGAEGKLRTTTINALKKADEKGIERIALPAMGAGYYGIPLDVSARATLGAVKEYLEGTETGLKEVVICLNDLREIPPFKSCLETIA